MKWRAPLLAKSGFMPRAFLPKPSPPRLLVLISRCACGLLSSRCIAHSTATPCSCGCDLLIDEFHEHRLALRGRGLARQGDGHVLGDLPAFLPAPLAGFPVQRLFGPLRLAPHPRCVTGPFRRVFRQDQTTSFQLVGAMRKVEAFAALIEAGITGDIGRQASGAAAGARLDNLHAHKPAGHLFASPPPHHLCQRKRVTKGLLNHHILRSKMYLSLRLTFYLFQLLVDHRQICGLDSKSLTILLGGADGWI